MSAHSGSDTAATTTVIPFNTLLELYKERANLLTAQLKLSNELSSLKLSFAEMQQQMELMQSTQLRVEPGFRHP
jgi:hypothetical protein